MEDRKIISSILRGVDITEVYSPQRVVDVCHKYQLIKGDSFDLRTGFDLSDPAVQKQVSKRIGETNAELVILSPPCTKFSTLQAFNLYLNGPAMKQSGKGKLIKGRWLDVNKGDSGSPDIRSRYVGKEFATGTRTRTRTHTHTHAH